MNINNVAENLNKQLAVLQKIKDDREKLQDTLDDALKYTELIKKELERENFVKEELMQIHSIIDMQKDSMSPAKAHAEIKRLNSDIVGISAFTSEEPFSSIISI